MQGQDHQEVEFTVRPGTLCGGQGLRKWLENDNVTVHFIWTKGHLADPGKIHKRTRTFVCAKGNKLADELATTGQEPEPEGGYRHWELPIQDVAYTRALPHRHLHEGHRAQKPR